MKTLRAGGSIVLAALFLSGCQPAGVEVEGWRAVTRDEAKTLADERRAHSPEQPPPITEVAGDFNGDGQRDRAMLLVNDAGDRFAPYLFDGAGSPPVQLDRGDARGRMFRYSLSVLPSGAIYGFCVEETADLRECEDKKDRRGQVVVFFEVDRGGTLYAWDGDGYVGETIGRALRGLSRARPADEHPLAQKPWYVSHRPMEPDARLSQFRRE